MEYFGSVKSIEELKSEYMKYLQKFKSDAELVEEINEQYNELLEGLGVEVNAKIDEENKVLPPEKQKERYEASKDKFAEVLQNIIDFNMDIEIIGQWIWCFNSYEYKEQLKELGFWYTASKKAWVYSGKGKRLIRSHNKVSDIRKKWGSEKIKDKEES